MNKRTSHTLAAGIVGTAILGFFIGNHLGITLENWPTLRPRKNTNQGYETHEIVASTAFPLMAPTLFPGNRVRVDKTYYKANNPERGDIVWYRHPSDPSQTSVRRIVGLPMERIEIIDERIAINGIQSKELKIDSRQCALILKRVQASVAIDETQNEENTECLEETVRGFKHTILKDRPPTIYKEGPLQVKTSHYYVECDNRFGWTGISKENEVPRENIIGKVLIRSSGGAQD